MLFVRAYPRETQEMVFDAHNRAFAFFRGACTRGIYDNIRHFAFLIRLVRFAKWLGRSCRLVVLSSSYLAF
jgi:hypothetical protein